MGQVFQQALPQGSEQDPYQMLMAELQKTQQPTPPMFTPEQAQQRLQQNQMRTQLGMLGQLAGDQRVRGVGSQVFKQALGDAEERVSNRGVMNPLTGEESVSPEYRDTQQEGRRGKLLQLALMKQQRDEANQARAARDTENRQHREDMIRLTSSLRPPRVGADPEITELRKDLLRTQIGAGQARVDQGIDKADAAASGAERAARNAMGVADLVIGKVDDAVKKANPLNTGVLGRVAGDLRTDTVNLQATLDTIKANLGFQELQAMREASPTGGALGQVAVRELDMLQAVRGNLNRAQSEPELVKNLQAIKVHSENWRNAMRMAATEASARRDALAQRRPGASPPGVPPVAPGGVPQPAPMAPPAPQRQVFRWINGQLVPVPQ